MTDSPRQRARWIGPALAILPLWLVVSAGVALWYAHFSDNKDAEEQQQRFVQTVSPELIADDLNKLVNLVGERHVSSETAASNLTRAAAMIEGVLGPSNTGYQVERIPGPANWPILRVSLPSSNSDTANLWVITSYDSRPGSAGAEANASGVAATIAAAQAMSRDQFECVVNFVFLPHANDLDSPVLEATKKLNQFIQPKDILLCVEAMGANNPLWISSRDTTALPLNASSGLGKVYGAEVICLGEDTDLASIFYQLGLSATRVATRPIITPDEADNTLPDARAVAASAGRLIELIQRCSTLAGAR